MKRAGFTMIELIFVIVILGILAAVALPKFLGVAEQAKGGKVTGFIGTMNRTVLPGVWSEAMSKGHDGKISAVDNKVLTTLTEVPEEITIASTTDFTTNCNAAGSSVVATYNIGQGSKNIYCFEGNTTNAPSFSFASGTDINMTMQ